MRRSACRSKSNSPLKPPSRPILTMRPRMRVAFMLCVGDAGRDEIDDRRRRPCRRSPRAPGRASADRCGSSARSQPYSLRRARFSALVEVPMTSFAPISLAICMPMMPTPALAAWMRTALARLQPALRHDRVVHGLEADRQGRRLLEGHVVGGDGGAAPGIGHGILGIAAVAAAHHALAGLADP